MNQLEHLKREDQVKLDTNIFWKVILQNLTPETEEFIRNDRALLIEHTHTQTIQSVRERVGMLRQWLNEDRIGSNGRMVTSEQILFWLTGDETLLKDLESEENNFEEFHSPKQRQHKTEVYVGVDTSNMKNARDLEAPVEGDGV